MQPHCRLPGPKVADRMARYPPDVGPKLATSDGLWGSELPGGRPPAVFACALRAIKPNTVTRFGAGVGQWKPGKDTTVQYLITCCDFADSVPSSPIVSPRLRPHQCRDAPMSLVGPIH